MTQRSLLPRSIPDDQQIDPAGILAFVDAAEQELDALHSFMVLRHGTVVAEGWWAPYSPDVPHSMFSVSKSFTAIAVGIAVHEGLLGIDDRVIDLLADAAPSSPSENLAAMRVRHLLTMTSGHAVDTVNIPDRDRYPSWEAALLAQPVDLEPGSQFVYDTGATYLLSAILHRLTGGRMLDYLTPRLLKPLGIEGAAWEQSPTGVDTGGWGLAITTEQLAAFGQFVLQRGEWNGEQLVPADWVEAAIAFQVPTVHANTSPDGSLGYGYQFWRGQHGSVRADGAFGQLAIVLAEQDAVVVTTSGVQEIQPLLDLVWRHLLPAFDRPSTASAEDLASRLSSLALPMVGRTVEPGAASVVGRRYRLAANGAGLEAVTVRESSVTLETPLGAILLEWNEEGWRQGSSPLPDGTPKRIESSGGWTTPETLEVRSVYVETPFATTLTLRFEADEVALDFRQNVDFDSTELARTRGRAD